MIRHREVTAGDATIHVAEAGGSRPGTTNGSKLAIARVLRSLVQALPLADADLTLVVRQPLLWHFALHAVPGLPEQAQAYAAISSFARGRQS